LLITLYGSIHITGRTGFIGSHACVAPAQADQLVILDNLCNSRTVVIDRLATLCGKIPVFIQGDIRDSAILDSLFLAHPINAENEISFPEIKEVA